MFSSWILFNIFELFIIQLFNSINSSLLLVNKIVENIKYEKINPYIKPKNLSKIMPKICLSRSELKNFLIFLSTNNETKNIIGIEITKPKILLNIS